MSFLLNSLPVSAHYDSACSVSLISVSAAGRLKLCRLWGSGPYLVTVSVPALPSRALLSLALLPYTLCMQFYNYKFYILNFTILYHFYQKLMASAIYQWNCPNYWRVVGSAVHWPFQLYLKRGRWWALKSKGDRREGRQLEYKGDHEHTSWESISNSASVDFLCTIIDQSPVDHISQSPSVVQRGLCLLSSPPYLSLLDCRSFLLVFLTPENQE